MPSSRTSATCSCGGRRCRRSRIIDGNVRRSRFVFFYVEDARSLDPLALLERRIELCDARQPLALSVLTGAAEPLTRREWSTLLDISANEWRPVEEIALPPSRILHLAHRGMLLSDLDDAELYALRHRERQLAETEWNPYAALYHFMTQWDDVRVLESGRASAEPSSIRNPLTVTPEPTMTDFVDAYGNPPSAFHHRNDAIGFVELPLVRGDHPLYELLSRRRTRRSFDAEAPLSIEDLGAVLYEAFGCHAWAPVHGEIVALGKTSPSGGGLHPIEVYPLVLNVGNLESGLYHYDVRNHRLEVLERIPPPRARRLADEFAAGQSFVSTAHVVLVLTARYYRNHWKYRRHPRSYAVILMDTAHLSQTMYLACTARGLGPFITAAINGRNIERSLKLDGISEGAVAIAGFGVCARDGPTPAPEFSPYDPRRPAILG